VQVIRIKTTRASLFAAALFASAFLCHVAIIGTLLNSEAYHTRRWMTEMAITDVRSRRVGLGLIGAALGCVFDMSTSLVILLSPKYCSRVSTCSVWGRNMCGNGRI
jgi:hypothetical protein